MRDKNWRQEPGGRRDDTCDHGLVISWKGDRCVWNKRKRRSNISGDIIFVSVFCRFIPRAWDFSGVARSFFSQSVLGWGIFLFLFFFSPFYFPASGQAVVTGVVPSPPRFLPSIFIARRVQQSHCSSIFHRMLLTHALALSASQFVRKKKSQRIYTSVPSAGLELKKLTYTRLEDNLLRHRGGPLCVHSSHEVFPKNIFSHIPWLACVARYVLHYRSMFLV